MFDDWEVIHRYTRRQAIADGVLIDVSGFAKEAGFVIPVALTRAVWEDCVAWTQADTGRKGWPQDQTGRLWDVLWMASLAGMRATQPSVEYVIVRVPREGRTHTAKEVRLVLHVGPGDDAEPVITIMQPGED